MYVGQLICNNKNCNFFTRSSMRNETEWSGQTNNPFKLGHLPHSDSILVCKVCKITLICVNFYPGCIYYVLGKGDMSRACIHLEMHNHLVSDGICQETLDTISGLIAREVSRTPFAKNFAITMAASKEFLDKYLIHTSPRSKKMLWGQELEDVLDKFGYLSSPNLRNTISLCRSGDKRGAYDSIMAMKTYTIMEYIYGNVFPGQGKERCMSSRCWKMDLEVVWTSSSACNQEEILRTLGSYLTMLSMSKNGPQWHVTSIMQHIARS